MGQLFIQLIVFENKTRSVYLFADYNLFINFNIEFLQDIFLIL